MAAERHNLTRRALLGVGAAVPLAHGLHAAPACPERSRGACPEPVQSEAEGRSRRAPTSRRWDRALAAYRRAEAEHAAFRACEKSLPPAARAWPACKPLEGRFGGLDDRRLAALRRLLAAPAPDLPALSSKLDLILGDLGWELSGCESCLAAGADDARRLMAASARV